MAETRPLNIFAERLESDRGYPNPTWDVTVQVEFTSPTGRHKQVDAFWDGGRTWRVRFAPDEAGTWSYRAQCSDTANTALHGHEGRFTVQPYEGDNTLFTHGSITLSSDKSSLVHADGTPFFWLADTAWNGVLKAKPEDWAHYLATRRAQGFTAVQCVMTQWRAFKEDRYGEVAFTGTEHVDINPRFFQRLDAKVAAIAEHGLVPVLVLLWALTPNDPGHYLPEDDCVKLARYIVARYGAYRASWFLGGDGRYLGANVDRWKRIGRAVFDEPAEHLVTLHPAGMAWTGHDFRGEPWFHYVGYQSGHGDDEPTLRWLVEGPPAQDWKAEPRCPIVNLEPNYEAHLAYQSRKPFDAHKVRRALYWSLLVSPTAGVTYGHHGIWPWMEERGIPLDHPNSGEAPTWQEALESEGAASVSHLKTFFSGIDWWKLRPAQDLLAEQPGEQDPNRFVAASAAEDNRFTVAYTPAGDAISLRQGSSASSGYWFNPRTEEALDIEAGGTRFTPPDSQDWVLYLRRHAG